MPSFTWDDGSTTRTSSYERNDAGAASAAAPIVILLHGADGNINHFRDPGRSPGFNIDQTWRPPQTMDFGWHGYPALPVLFASDPSMAVEGIEPFLVRNGFRTVNYSQVDPNGLLRRPVLQFDAIYRQVRRDFPQAPIHIVCHSRGGLLIRRWLATSRRLGSPSLTAIKSVQTLNSPHRGSALADIQRGLDQIGALFTQGPFGVRTYMDQYRSTSVMMELALLGNTFLTQLESDEKALTAMGGGVLHPGITFHAFAGTAPRLGRLHWYAAQPISQVFQWHWPPFQWLGAWARLQYDVPDSVAGILPPEAQPGRGDILVSVTSSVPRTWTPAATWSFPVNHSSVLWNSSVKSRVLANLGGRQPVAVAVGRVSVMVGDLVPNQTHTATVNVTNAGVHAWTNQVTVRTVDPFPAAPWSVRVIDLPANRSRSLSHGVRAPATTGTYQLGWALHHDQAGELDRFTRSVRVMNTCEQLAQDIREAEEELEYLKDRVRPGAAGRYTRQRIVNLSRTIATLRRKRARLGC